MISAELQRLTLDNIVVLYELDLTPVGGTDVLRFHPGVSALGNNIVWAGNEYTRLPIQAQGFERTGSGSLPRPKVAIANIDGLISYEARRYRGGMEGASLTRTRTFMKYLDAANFGGVNPSADPSQYIERETWMLARKTNESPVFVEYELAASIDLPGLMLPRRQVIQNVCTWTYRGPDCGYSGPPVADIADRPTTDPTRDKCGCRLTSCKLRWGENAILPFGGFPGAGLTR